MRLIFKPTRFPVSAQSFLQKYCKYYRSNRVYSFTEPAVLELLKTKSDATSATLVVSAEIYNYSSRPFPSGTGFALSQQALVFLRLTRKQSPRLKIAEFGVNKGPQSSSGNYSTEEPNKIISIVIASAFCLPPLALHW